GTAAAAVAVRPFRLRGVEVRGGHIGNRDTAPGPYVVRDVGRGVRRGGGCVRDLGAARGRRWRGGGRRTVDGVGPGGAGSDRERGQTRGCRRGQRVRRGGTGIGHGVRARPG